MDKIIVDISRKSDKFMREKFERTEKSKIIVLNVEHMFVPFAIVVICLILSSAIFATEVLKDRFSQI